MVVAVAHGERKRWRKKPLEVDAWQWNGGMDTAAAIVGWIEKAHPAGVASFSPAIYHGAEMSSPAAIAIETKEGVMNAVAGDFVIREPFPTADRTFYPCKPSIFTGSYEPA